MSWMDILKAPPMMEVAQGEYVPMAFGDAESSQHFEMNPDKLVNDLNALDLDVKIIQMEKGYIDPTITHEVQDAEGSKTTVMSNSPRHMKYGDNKKVWQGLRMITERRIGNLKQKELRKRFPMYHIDGPMKAKLDADIKFREQYPEAVEYFFSPRKELIDSQRTSNPGSTPRYGASQRTVQQHNRWIQEAEKYDVLDTNGKVNESKFIVAIEKMIEESEPLEPPIELMDVIKKHLKQFIDIVPSHFELDTDAILEKMIGLTVKQAIIQHKKLMHLILKDEKARNSIIAEFVGKGSPLPKTFQGRVYDVSTKNLESNMGQIVSEAKKDSSWPDVKKLIEDTRRKQSFVRNRQNFRRKTNKSVRWFETIRGIQ